MSHFEFRFNPFERVIHIVPRNSEYTGFPIIKDIELYWFADSIHYRNLQPLYNLPPFEIKIRVGQIIHLHNTYYICVFIHDKFPVFTVFKGAR